MLIYVNTTAFHSKSEIQPQSKEKVKQKMAVEKCGGDNSRKKVYA
jgi:hypothetical protein